MVSNLFTFIAFLQLQTLQSKLLIFRNRARIFKSHVGILIPSVLTIFSEMVANKVVGPIIEYRKRHSACIIFQNDNEMIFFAHFLYDNFQHSLLQFLTDKIYRYTKKVHLVLVNFSKLVFGQSYHSKIEVLQN